MAGIVAKKGGKLKKSVKGPRRGHKLAKNTAKMEGGRAVGGSEVEKTRPGLRRQPAWSL